MQLKRKDHLHGRTYLLLFLIAACCACRTDPPSEETSFRASRTFAKFFVRYLAPEQQLRGQASFWEGLSWSNLDPVIPAGIVSFDGQEMTSKRLPGEQIRFSLTENTDYKEPVTFRFRMPDGRYMQYELKMSPIRDFFIKGKVSKREGAVIVVNGGLINEGETLVLMFTDAARKAQAITIEGPRKDIEIFVGPEQLRELTPGPGQLYLVKKMEKAESHSDLELTAAVEYYTGSRLIEVTP